MGHANLVVTDQSADYPDFLKRASNSSNKQANIYQAPVIINMELESGAEQLKELVAKHSSLDVIDNYAEQYAELLLSRNAHLYRANYDVQVASIQETLEQHYGAKKAWQMGSWVFFPWNNQLIHILAQEDFENLRTIRNRDLIDEEEQKKLLDFSVASFGMSVGSAGAMVLSLSGISRKIKLIDGAVISGSNLNRILTGVSSVGKSKALVVGQQIYEMNPYSSVEHFDKVNKDNIEEIFDKPWKIDLAVDEIDDIEMKVRIRFEARKRKIPVIMATELGDTVMLDVERFDEEKDRKLFHGLVPNIEDLLDKPLENYREWTKHAVSIIDPENMPIKMQKSVLKIGTNIVTHPQLGSTVMMTGGVLTFAAKHIALGNQLKSGRYIIALEKEFLSDHKTRKHRREHKKHTKIIKRSVSSM
jgi:molybdopterin/thiamine biosynthesis adenylyltransferase